MALEIRVRDYKGRKIVCRLAWLLCSEAGTQPPDSPRCFPHPLFLHGPKAGLCRDSVEVGSERPRRLSKVAQLQRSWASHRVVAAGMGRGRGIQEQFGR